MPVRPLPTAAQVIDDYVTPVLDYLTPSLGLPGNWVLAAQCQTAGQWHALKQPLAKLNIVALMRNGTSIDAQESAAQSGYQLLVQEADLPRARPVIEAVRAHQPLCPRCGSPAIRTIDPTPKRPTQVLSYLSRLPFRSPLKICDNCTKQFR